MSTVRMCVHCSVWASLFSIESEALLHEFHNQEFESVSASRGLEELSSEPQLLLEVTQRA